MLSGQNSGRENLSSMLSVDVKLVNKIDGEKNTLLTMKLDTSDLYFQVKNDGKRVANLAYKIGFRNNFNELVYDGEFEREIESQKLTSKYIFVKHQFQLPRGNYAFHLELRNKPKFSFLYETREYFCDNFSDSLSISDIQLSRAFGNQQLSIDSLQDFSKNKKLLTFSFDVYSDRLEQVQIKAQLYHKNSMQNQDDAIVYDALSQFNDILNISSSRTNYSNQLLIPTNITGEYILNVLIFEENILLEQKSLTFFVKWQGLKSVFRNLDWSIRQSFYVMNESQQQQFLQESSHKKKLSLFIKFWRQKNSNIEKYEYAEMESHFKKLYAISDFLQKKRPNLTLLPDQLLFDLGKPTKHDLIEIAQRELVVWRFTNANTTEIFEQKGEELHKISVSSIVWQQLF